METRIFRLNPESYPALRKRIIIRTTLLMLIVWGGVSFILLKDGDEDGTGLWFVVGMALFYGYLIFKTSKKRRKIYGSYTLIIDELNITRKQDGLKDMQIPLSEITIIEKNAENRFVIRGKSKAPFERILIPRQVEGYDRVEEILAGIKPIEINLKPNYLEKYGLLITLIFMAPILGVYIVDNKIIVSICAVLAVTMLVYSMFYMSKYKNTVKSWKRTLWFLPLIIISILVVVYFKLIS
ncbi:hypothetical protein [Mucilaginibacter sp. SJ]|uniref:hypothetical protein n=1 Tax=Mucilaginibacter sp. SJ TaxID=3029053 RepID=UPI0023A9EF6E|nr:hypothetical protein [Mucilaginibacter sp. SJ]WEA02966.1 hypothetical protein MusilaSJ_08470 [Mucilaginibacter sp. SJ]